MSNTIESCRPGFASLLLLSLAVKIPDKNAGKFIFIRQIASTWTLASGATDVLDELGVDETTLLALEVKGTS
jgi:hypothetical protein